MVHATAPFYSTLIRVNPMNPGSTTDIVCDLCTEMPKPTDDGKTYTFKIRQDVKFHNGDKLTAEDVAASLRSTPQIAHRLEVKRQSGGAIVIDDAYNSNPVGFASALALLDTLRQPGGRRILVTPGMAELGSEHEAEHARIGHLAAAHVDILVAVAPHRVAPLIAGFSEAAPERTIVSCATFADARSWLDSNLAGNDVVLIENDLPDILEQKLRL